jgi:hypothetical protein
MGPASIEGVAMNSPIFFWAGWAVTAVVTGSLIFAFVMYIFKPEVPWRSMEEVGLPKKFMVLIGTMELLVGLIYAFPPTAVLGAILITGLFGGTYAIHFRMGRLAYGSQIISIAYGVMAWGGLWLRDARLRELLPFN